MICRYSPDSDSDRADANRYGAEAWMLAALATNPSYVGWGPGEDYMPSPDSKPNGGGWNSSVEVATWGECGFRDVDDLNVIARFYFSIDRDSEACVECDGSGYGPMARDLERTFYGSGSRGGWNTRLTIDDVQALVDAGRLTGQGQAPTVDDDFVRRVNEANRSGPGLGELSHDAINRYVLIEHRCTKAGEATSCAFCDGHGYVFTSPRARLGLTLWVLHPRKGASRGVRVREIQQAELGDVYLVLREAARQNAESFGGIPSP